MTLSRGSLLLFLALLPSACALPRYHEPPESRWLHPSTGRASANFSPPPAPAPGNISFSYGRPLRVAVFADTHGNIGIQQRVVQAIRGQDPDLAIFAGDALTCTPLGHIPDLGPAAYAIPAWPQYLRGHPEFTLASIVPFPALVHEIFGSPCGFPHDPDGFNRFLEATAPLRLDDETPLLFAPGNHDTYKHSDRAVIAGLFGSPDGLSGASPDRLWFSVDAGRWRFVILDSGTDLPFDGDPLEAGGAQLEWLEATLSEADRFGMQVAVSMHCPPYSSAAEDPPSPRLDERVVRGVLDHHDVAMVLCGHEHAYERLERRGVTYVITGCGGGKFDEDVPVEKRDPRSQVYVTGNHGYVMLELGEEGWRGRALSVDGTVLDRFGPGIVEAGSVATR